jgi:RNA polymerase sigma-70 factor (ECF subfamily)
MLGTLDEADDVVQEAWLRWSAADRSGVASPRAYLVRVVTRLCLDALGTARARRETYVGPWLPEPLVRGSAPDPAEAVERGEAVSYAVQVLLESLSPLERAAFVLREAFDVPYDEVAEALGREPAAVRQLVARARRHVDARGPRYDVSAEQAHAAVRGFLDAAARGDLTALLSALAPDVVLTSDGGGRVSAAGGRWPAPTRSRASCGLARRPPEGLEVRLVDVDGTPGVLMLVPGGPRASGRSTSTTARCAASGSCATRRSCAGCRPA